MEVTVDGTLYTYTNPISGATAVFDTATGVLSIDDRDNFVLSSTEEEAS